jgi:hypothetical protein
VVAHQGTDPQQMYVALILNTTPNTLSTSQLGCWD